MPKVSKYMSAENWADEPLWDERDVPDDVLDIKNKVFDIETDLAELKSELKFGFLGIWIVILFCLWFVAQNLGWTFR